METPRYTRILRERWYVIVIAALVGLLAAFAVGRSSPPNYAATATLFLRVEATDTSLLERSQFSLARIKSYVDLVSSPSVLQDTIDDLGLDVSVEALAEDVSASNPPDTVLLEVTAESDDPAEAALIANAVARNLAADIGELESGSAEGSYAITLDLRIPADNARSTTATQLAILLGLGLLGGLAVGVVTATLLVVLDPRVRTTDDVRRSTGLPVVGQLPSSVRRVRRGKPFARDLADAFRGFLVDLRLITGGTDPQYLVLVPTSPGDRSDLVRLGVARTMALSGLSVAVVALDPADPLAVVSSDDDAPPALHDAESDVAEAEADTDDADAVESPDADADVANPSKPAGAPATGGSFARAASGIRSGVGMTARRIRARFASRPRQVPGEPFAIATADRPLANAREREAALVALAKEAAASADTVILVAPGGEGVPALAQLAGTTVVIVADARTTRRARLSSVSTALEFAGVQPTGVLMTSVSARRRDDLPSTWFESDRIARPEARGVRQRRSGPKPTAAGGGKKQSGAATSEPVGRVDPVDLTLDFGEPEAIAG